MTTLVLADNYREAHRFARDFEIGRIVVATSAAAVENTRPTKVYQLPSFEQRPDRHSIRAALIRTLRKTPGAEVIIVDQKTLDAVAAESASTRAAAAVLAETPEPPREHYGAPVR